MAAILRGKASTPARPGIVIKQVLMGERPLISGEIVSEAAIVDLANVYKQFIYEQNQLRTRESRLKGMVYMSFVKLFKFAQLLGLVELVREEPMLFPPPKGHLYSVRKRETDGIRVFAVISKRRVFKLTDVGREDERSWSDLCKAWREGWAAPQKLEVPIVLEKIPEEIPEVPVEEILPPKVKRVRVPKVKKVPALKLKVKPSKEQYVLLLDHMHALNEIGIRDKEVQKEVDRLAYAVGEWVAETIEQLEDATAAGDKTRAIEARYLRNVLTAADEGLLDRDIPQAIEHLKKLVPGYVAPAAKPTEVVEPVPEEPTEPEAKPDIDELRSMLSGLMDESKKAASIKKLEKALAGLDYDKYEGLEDVESAIEDYRGAEREDKESAFEDIISAIDSIELVEEEEK